MATIVFEKYGQHQPLNRQRDRYAREGVDLSLSTLADQVGACTVWDRTGLVMVYKRLEGGGFQCPRPYPRLQDQPRRRTAALELRANRRSNGQYLIDQGAVRHRAQFGGEAPRPIEPPARDQQAEAGA